MWLCGDLFKGDWLIVVLFKFLVLNGILNGVLNEIVIDERVEFSNLFIFYYGIGYEFVF